MPFISKKHFIKIKRHQIKHKKTPKKDNFSEFLRKLSDQVTSVTARMLPSLLI